MKKIVLLGSTGSIGTSTLSLVERHPDRFRVLALTANRSLDLLMEQIRRFCPEAVAVADPEAAAELRKKTGVRVLVGEAGMCEAAAMPGADIVLSAVVGAAGLAPTLAAVRAGKTIALANKETLVVAGDVVMSEARKSGSRILPVDSEHSAIFQCLEGRDPSTVRRVILTASGGPFFGRSREELEHIRPEDALKHPSWSMGRKITIDSATLMNKGLEVIEAHHLFNLPPDKIDVVVHPQSIVHSMVEYIDGSVLAQMSVPDMRGAIAYAMTWPGRVEGAVNYLDLASVGSLTFKKPDLVTFPCLAYAYDALREGGTMPAVLNAANEAAVEAFLAGRISFTRIPVIILNTMMRHSKTPATSYEQVAEAHRWAERAAREAIG